MKLRRQTLTFTTTRLKEHVVEQQRRRSEAATKHKVLLRSYQSTQTTPTTPTPTTPGTKWASQHSPGGPGGGSGQGGADSMSWPPGGRSEQDTPPWPPTPDPTPLLLQTWGPKLCSHCPPFLGRGGATWQTGHTHTGLVLRDLMTGHLAPETRLALKADNLPPVRQHALASVFCTGASSPQTRGPSPSVPPP